MKPIIYVDGAAGTTGLEIRERLAGRSDIELISLSGNDRKDLAARSRVLNEADIAILCLPDEAARESVASIRNPAVRVLDASTAHRAAPGWVYGFAELESGRREVIAAARHVSNPGCYPTGFLALVRPLVRAGVVPADYPLTVNAVSGYSGGGKAMIEEFEDDASPCFTRAVVRTYALALSHKHIPEMQIHGGLAHPPVFMPLVGRFYRGMLVEVPLQLWALPGRPGVSDIFDVLAAAYAREALVEVLAVDGAPATLDAELMKDSDRMKLFVFGNETIGQVRLVAALDNLGKGAGGAGVQNLNLMLGVPETTGLR
ncbi:MAG TPA: N-acetyl-gamma-glutamyl-phosphate reductase [Rhizomicrobium sp.]|nr:N-acetyl-gamma-glutamyl-phosphate reductase [Rhizomicrobium sp.]